MGASAPATRAEAHVLHPRRIADASERRDRRSWALAPGRADPLGCGLANGRTRAHRRPWGPVPGGSPAARADGLRALAWGILVPMPVRPTSHIPIAIEPPPPKHPSSATTREGRSSAPQAATPGGFLRRGHVIEGSSRSVRFIIGNEIGAGGFGRVYLAEAAGRGARSLPKRLCVKTTSDLQSWICEAYSAFC